ncbi:MAG: ABC transporter ATP-binding protein [Spirochaetales bacterium]|nr:ABC transporter ATP-binding protein [Spirochaetales bacterium]
MLTIRNITKTFNGIERLKNVSFNLKKGEFLLIAGSNGSGKTLLMKHINGLYPIKKNTVFLDGEDYYKKDSELKKKIGIVFQNPDTQFVGLTVEDDIKFGLKNLGFKKKEIEERTEEILIKLNISHIRDRNPFTLSGGEKKRVNIAGILVMSPEIIIFDEPFIGLDYPGVIDLTNAILDLKNSGETIILISHDLEKILAYVNRVIVLNNGEIVANDTPENIINIVEQWGIRRPVQDKIEDMTWLK